MAGTQSHGSDTCCMSLMNLPQDILYNIFAHLDEGSLCEAAQICPAFLRLAGMQCLQLYINLVYHVMAPKTPHKCFRRLPGNANFWMHMPSGVWPGRNSGFQAFQQVTCQQQVTDLASATTEDRLKLASTSCLSRALRLPPQVACSHHDGHGLTCGNLPEVC